MLEQKRFRSQEQLVPCRDSLVIHGQDHNLVVLLQHKNGAVPRPDGLIRGHCIKREEQNRVVVSDNRKRKERERQHIRTEREKNRREKREKCRIRT